MQRRILFRQSAMLVTFVGALLVGFAALVQASGYEAYGQTRWEYTNRGYCCEDAIILAQNNSMAQCERAGGYPSVSRHSARGRCDTESRRGSKGRPVYRCSATASVNCR